MHAMFLFVWKGTLIVVHKEQCVCVCVCVSNELSVTVVCLVTPRRSVCMFCDEEDHVLGVLLMMKC